MTCNNAGSSGVDANCRSARHVVAFSCRWSLVSMPTAIFDCSLGMVGATLPPRRVVGPAYPGRPMYTDPRDRPAVPAVSTRGRRTARRCGWRCTPCEAGGGCLLPPQHRSPRSAARTSATTGNAAPVARQGLPADRPSGAISRQTRRA